MTLNFASSDGDVMTQLFTQHVTALRSSSSFEIVSEEINTNSSLASLTDVNTTPAGDDVSAHLSLLNTILLSIVAGILALATSLGNLMVIVSFKMDRQLQTVSNYFLLSLSVADLSIGVISMPLYTTDRKSVV